MDLGTAQTEVRFFLRFCLAIPAGQTDSIAGGACFPLLFPLLESMELGLNRISGISTTIRTECVECSAREDTNITHIFRSFLVLSKIKFGNVGQQQHLDMPGNGRDDSSVGLRRNASAKGRLKSPDVRRAAAGKDGGGGGGGRGSRGATPERKVRMYTCTTHHTPRT